MVNLRYSDDDIRLAVENSTSVMGVLRAIGYKSPSGGMHSHIKRRIATLGLDTSHFTGSAHTRGLPALNRKTGEQYLIRLPPDAVKRTAPHRLRRALVEAGVPEHCNECETPPFWNGRPLVLQVDHIDGDWRNNLFSNLQLLCPNCHSQKTLSPLVAMV